MPSMVDRLGNDAHYIVATARLFGWRVAWHADGRLHLDRDGHRIRVLFTSAGGFRHAKARAGTPSWQRLELQELVRLLEGESTDMRSTA